MTSFHPYGPRKEKHSSSDLDVFTYFFLRMVKHEIPDGELKIFNEEALAKAIRAAVKNDRVEAERFMLAIADALDHPSAFIRLKLQRIKAGNFLTFPRVLEQSKKQFEIATTVWREFHASGKMEAGLAEAKSVCGVSTNTIYKALRSEAEYLCTCEADASIVRFEWYDTMGDDFIEFANWVKRYLDEPRTDES